MDCRMELINKDGIEVKLEAVMTLRDWKLIRRDLVGSSLPSTEFIIKIRDLVNQVDKHFYPKEET